MNPWIAGFVTLVWTKKQLIMHIAAILLNCGHGRALFFF
jgi:hypothetical protein